MTVRRLLPTLPNTYQARDNSGPRTPESPAMVALVDFVRRKGPVTQRDVAMRFSLRMDGAQIRLEKGVQFKLLVEIEPGKWALAPGEAA